MRPKTLILVALLGVFGFFVVRSFGSQVAGYETFAEASANGRQAHVVGVWDESAPAQYDPARNEFSFAMTDEAGATRRVVYAAPKPANFEDAEKVVVDGRMAGDVFVAEHILVKCPSKYNDERGLEAPAAEGPTQASL